MNTQTKPLEIILNEEAIKEFSHKLADEVCHKISNAEFEPEVTKAILYPRQLVLEILIQILQTRI